jgi:quercetin dioxygenase-like cupin family protein
MRKDIALGFVTALIIYTSIHARSEQDSGNLLFENDQLRAVEYLIQSGGKLSLQSHAPYIFFCVNPIVATLRFKDGRRVSASFKVDDFRWYENPIIEVANRGESEARFLIIELKKPSPTNHGDVPADDGTKLAPDVYRLLYQNDRVRVIRVGTKPGRKTPMHSHPGSAFRYSMANTKVRFTMPDGTTRELESTAGVARWTELATRHAHENIGITEGRTLLVEIK